jgi:hypothetical protein
VYATLFADYMAAVVGVAMGGEVKMRGVLSK